MVKKVCKKEIDILIVLHLIVLKYLIKNLESTFTIYLYWINITSILLEKKYLSKIGTLGQQNKKNKNAYKNYGRVESNSLLIQKGFYYYNARWYDPNIGRFITEDPARDGLNWFIYTSNNPLNRIDPTGLGDIADLAKAEQEMNDFDPFIVNEKASFSITPGENTEPVEGNTINPSIQGEAHFNNYSTGASIDVTTGGATTGEQTVRQFNEDVSITAEAKVEAITGRAALGLTDGRPNVELIGSMIDVSAETTLNVGDFNGSVSVTALLLSAGIKVDLSSGFDFKIGLGFAGFGFSLGVSHDQAGDIFTKSLK